MKGSKQDMVRVQGECKQRLGGQDFASSAAVSWFGLAQHKWQCGQCLGDILCRADSWNSVVWFSTP